VSIARILSLVKELWVWQGRLISTYVNSPGNRYNKAVADLGLNCYLKMLLNDNFIHADLHPGAPARPSVAGNAASSTACQSLLTCCTEPPWRDLAVRSGVTVMRRTIAFCIALTDVTTSRVPGAGMGSCIWAADPNGRS